MMTTKKIISWVKWKNPYRHSRKPYSDIEENDNYDVAGINLLEKDRHNKDNEDDDEENNENRLIMFTPLGYVPLTEHNDPEKIFDFWIGHTNFNISPGIKKVINKVEGVEILNIYTRYRFRIGVAKMFVPRDVTQNINRAITAYFQENIDEEQQELSECGHGSTPCDQCRHERNIST